MIITLSECLPAVELISIYSDPVLVRSRGRMCRNAAVVLPPVVVS